MPVHTKIQGSYFVGFVYLMNEETTGWKSRSVSTPRDGKRGLIHAVCHLSVLVSYIFLEIEATEEWSVQLDSYRWRLSQEIPDLWFEQKISDSILIFSCVFAENSDAGFVAIVTSCRITLNGLHNGFVDLKNEAGSVTEISWWQFRKSFKYFLPVFSFLLQNWFLTLFLTGSW